VAWALFHRHLTAQRKVDPAAQLVMKASQLAKLFPAAFVVMGHTHAPVHTPAGDATYINLGSWAEDEMEDPAESSAPRATRTHLVIHVRESRPEAGLFTWGSDGPKHYDVPREPEVG
jgi:predicted phosphodiesterase